MRTARGGEEHLLLCIVDADVSVREALCRLASAAGFRPQPFASVEQFMAHSSPNGKGCVLLDSSMLRVDKQFKATM